MKKWLLIIAVIILLGGGIIWLIQYRYFHNEPLSEAEAVGHIETIYHAQVTDVEKQGDTYKMLLTREQVIYAVTFDAITQQVIDLSMKEAQRPLLLTENEIRQLVKKEYSDVESIILTDNIYTVRVEQEDKQKELTVDAYSGEIVAERAIEPSKQPVAEHIISQQQAIQIAQQQLNGEVDSVDFEETADGGYYLIEIETENDEATFQIHAISGKVMSITWDDDQ
ncbi:PepSY domain-containing protein [Lysinibacillus sp. FSL K6-0232]|uniref:PepSY domain-containing protein n=1 Tax=unclassified Lysinibacillus TaxID=2636778 RepID=UPI0030FCC2EE